jgi:hypothetical protein
MVESEHDLRTTTLPRLYALVVGIIYLVLGVAGFFVATQIWVFSTGPLLDVVRTAIGLVALVAARRATTSQLLSWALFVLLAGLTAFGILAAALGTPGDITGFFTIRWADDWLHGLTAVAGLLTGTVVGLRRWPR